VAGHDNVVEIKTLQSTHALNKTLSLIQSLVRDGFGMLPSEPYVTFCQKVVPYSMATMTDSIFIKEKSGFIH
jgi:hypothetical protein